MRTFRCACDATIFFRNSQCLACERELGFLPDRGVLSALDPDPAAQGAFTALAAQGASYRKCENYAVHGVCNWMVPADRQGETLCASCRLNRTIPALDDPESRTLWAEIEVAKRHAVYTLLRLGLPVVSKLDDEKGGLAFDFLVPVPDQPVLTGHADGVITLNVREANPVEREAMRVKLGEGYRTLLGHFRHEIGHYYFQRLIEGSPHVPAFRRLFGDEREDYEKALERHYASPSVPEGWNELFISSYAASHPWEDWAETWAHYLHMRDTLETAQDLGLHRPSDAREFPALLSEWLELTVALNALNRSMGLPDPYPFQIGERPAAKLGFVHEVIAKLPSGCGTPAPA